MKFINGVLVLLLFLFSAAFCENSSKKVVALRKNKSFFDQVDSTRSGKRNTIFEIASDFDLGGREIAIPKDCVLRFKGGKLSNGILVGNHSGIEYEGCVFSSIKIVGSWDVPVIESNMFADATENNVIKNLVAMSCDSIQNDIVISEGVYEVSVTDEQPSVLELKSNTNLHINGDIMLAPTNAGLYYIVHIDSAFNITVSGTGRIVGDKCNHLSKKYRSGHLIGIGEAENVTIKGLTLEKPWGDCILVGNRGVVPNRVTIEGCKLLDGRRQGISIGSGENITIRDCIISRVSESCTDLVSEVGPCAGIDIENLNNVPIRNVSILNVIVDSASRGLEIYNDNAPGEGSCENIFVSGYVATNCYGRGLFIAYNVKDITIENSHFEAVDDAFYGFSLFDDTIHQYSDPNEQTNIIVRDSRFRLLNSKRAYLLHCRHPNITFEDCEFEEKGPSVWRVYATASGCSFNRCKVTGTKIELFEKTEINHSEIYCKQFVDNSQGSTFKNNKIIYDK